MKNKNILITGGSGFLGQELTSHLLLLNPNKITIFSRNEASQVLMKTKFNDKRINYVIGDVRDYNALSYSMENVDFVFHLAALKHIGICEEQPDEAIKTNINGTMNVIESAIKNKVSRVVLMSTDKVIYPASLYGMTKGICERLFIKANSFSKDTEFIVIRTGNIIGSSGSVVPLFIDRAKRGLSIVVTNKDMTRFFLPASEVSDILIYACLHGKNSGIYIPIMKSYYIYDLAKIIAKYYGVDIEISMAKSNEAIHELIISSHECSFTFIENNMYVIQNGYIADKDIGFKQLSSNDRLSDLDNLYELLLDTKLL